jgi:CheY-like chemotaxis protein
MMRDILVIDDDQDDVSLFQEALYEVDPLVNFHSAKGGLKALDFLLGKSTIIPDVIFLDINMPGMNGWRCLTELKSTPRLTQIPIIMLSTTATKKDEEKASGLGAIGIYQKPERFEELIHLLKAVIGSLA